MLSRPAAGAGAGPVGPGRGDDGHRDAGIGEACERAPPSVLPLRTSAPGALEAGAAVARDRPLVWALSANLLFHSLIAHKEYRFVWISTWSVLVLAAITATLLAVWLVARSLVGPLRTLRDSALRVAHTDLEQEIARLRAGTEPRFGTRGRR